MGHDTCEGKCAQLQRERELKSEKELLRMQEAGKAGSKKYCAKYHLKIDPTLQLLTNTISWLMAQRSNMTAVNQVPKSPLAPAHLHTGRTVHSVYMAASGREKVWLKNQNLAFLSVNYIQTRRTF